MREAVSRLSPAVRRQFGFAALAVVVALGLLAARGDSTVDKASAGLVVPCLTIPNVPAPDPVGSETGPGDPKQKVFFTGNNWDGTADVIATNGPHRFKRVARLNIVPDYEERIAEICSNPVDLGYFVAIRELIGEGNDQLVDDLYSTPDGKLLVVSRPSFRDVVAIHLTGPDTGDIAWRFQVDGQRSDHMALSPNGKQVAVSASTANVVHLLNTKTGIEEGTFESGDSPHENNYSADGKRIYHASIGLVYTPGDDAAMDTNTNKGDRYFQVVNAKTQEIISRVDMGDKLEEAGYPNMSSAVRPMAISKNERKAYLQVSFFHGVVTYNIRKEKVLNVMRLPNLVPNVPREQYLLDSAHHGIALSGNDKRLCIAGTMSDYATVIRAKQARRKDSLDPKLLKYGTKPYWSTTSANGKNCYVSWSGTDSMSVISYRKGKEIKHIEVGDHPQRIRNGVVRKSFLAANALH